MQSITAELKAIETNGLAIYEDPTFDGTEPDVMSHNLFINVRLNDLLHDFLTRKSFPEDINVRKGVQGACVTLKSIAGYGLKVISATEYNDLKEAKHPVFMHYEKMFNDRMEFCNMYLSKR